MNLLHTLGLMKRSEHEAAALQAAADKQLLEKLTAQRDQTITAMVHAEFSRDCWRDLARGHEAKFKRAATDLAAQAEENEALKADRDDWKAAKTYWEKEAKIARAAEDAHRIYADALRPDAEAMRKKRAADRKRMAGKRGKDNG